MPIIIRDETANLLLLTIDNTGQMYFGDGTPISMLTLAGYGMATAASTRVYWSRQSLAESPMSSWTPTFRQASGHGLPRTLTHRTPAESR
jgi:hypothetical protein